MKISPPQTLTPLAFLNPSLPWLRECHLVHKKRFPGGSPHPGSAIMSVQLPFWKAGVGARSSLLQASQAQPALAGGPVLSLLAPSLCRGSSEWDRVSGFQNPEVPWPP